MNDVRPGQAPSRPAADPFTPPSPEVGAVLGGVAAPVVALPPNPAKDDAPKRATTRAGRKAQAAANAARKSTKTESAPKSPKATPRRASLETRLTGSLVTLGTIVAGTGGMVSPAVQADGILIVEHAANVASALDKLAKDQPAVAAALERMMTAGAYSGIIAALLPLVVGIAANHGAIPPSLATMLGTAPPEPEQPGGPVG